MIFFNELNQVWVPEAIQIILSKGVYVLNAEVSLWFVKSVWMWRLSEVLFFEV